MSTCQSRRISTGREGLGDGAFDMGVNSKTTQAIRPLGYIVHRNIFRNPYAFSEDAAFNRSKTLPSASRWAIARSAGR